MKFYNREKELELLESIKHNSSVEAQMTVVIGRRRIGKTSLLKKAIEHDSSAIYLFVTRKSEVLICEEFKEEIERKLQMTLHGHFSRFKDLFHYLMDLSATKQLTFIVDEFQEFNSINPSVFSEIQKIWDSGKSTSKMNLILCGSIYSVMKKIFEHAKEPLFGRATSRIQVKPFQVDTLEEILREHHPAFSPDDLLAFFSITGGVAKYVELLISKKAFTRKKMFDEILKEHSLFLEEGKNLLIEEFGKDYSIYFSIISLIASSKTSRTEIESILEISVGGYLEKLESDFNLIRKVKPLFAKPGSRTLKYEIVDNFLSFWFRFIYKFQSTVEIGNFDYLRMLLERDYPTYSGRMLEKFLREKLSLSKKYAVVGTWWEKGNLNELDIVAIDHLNSKVLFAEVKRKKENVNLHLLQTKSLKFLEHNLPNYFAEYKGFSLEDLVSNS